MVLTSEHWFSSFHEYVARVEGESQRPCLKIIRLFLQYLSAKEEILVTAKRVVCMRTIVYATGSVLYSMEYHINFYKEDVTATRSRWFSLLNIGFHTSTSA